MSRFALLTLAALALGACGQDRSEPLAVDQLDVFTADFSSIAYGMTGGQPGPGLAELARLKRLPDAIKLTAEQEAAITKLLDDFQTANQADLDKLAALMTQVRDALAAGKTRAEIAPLLEQARTIHLRIAAATAKLKLDMNAVLTTEQRTWLASGSPARCYPVMVAPLSREQQTAIHTLNQAFVTATATDRAAVRAALEAARKAKAEGKSAAEIRAILEPVQDAMKRLQAAGEKLRADIWAVLTPAQQASGCFGPAPRTGT